MTANVRAFCEVIENAGYEAAVYANKAFLTNQIDGAALSKDYKVCLLYTSRLDIRRGESCAEKLSYAEFFKF